MLANYNADRRDLFTAAGRDYLAKVEVSTADRFVLDQLLASAALPVLGAEGGGG